MTVRPQDLDGPVELGPRLPAASTEAGSNGAGERSDGDHRGAWFVSGREYLALPREPIEPYVATPDGRSVLLARDTGLIVAGPSGVGKSLAAVFDLGGRLAADEPSEWIGLAVCGGLRVSALVLEGSDEDTADRVRALVPGDALDRFQLLDRWRGPALRSGEPHREQLARLLAAHRTDVLIIDTASAFFGASFDIARGIPEEAHGVIEDLRARSGHRFGCVTAMHTKKADRGGARVDELEEISGTFPRKADAAIVIRQEAEDSPRRIVRFPKTRRGPKPRTVIATLPLEDSNESPRLTLVAEAGRPVKDGTEAEAMAEWIQQQDGPVSASDLRDRFDVSDSTLRDRRRLQLEALGVLRHKLPGQGNTYGYGTEDQWRALRLGEAA